MHIFLKLSYLLLSVTFRTSIVYSKIDIPCATFNETILALVSKTLLNALYFEDHAFILQLLIYVKMESYAECFVESSVDIRKISHTFRVLIHRIPNTDFQSGTFFSGCWKEFLV